MMQQLAPGEHVDLDSGVTVERKKNGLQYVIDAGDAGRIALFEQEVKDVAELAGFGVTES